MTQADAIQQFVQGDFASRRALLNQWPGGLEQLDQLAQYVEQQQLYSGANGQTYILESDERLLHYPALEPVSDWPSDLAQVTLVNTLQKALTFALAHSKMQSKMRLSALKLSIFMKAICLNYSWRRSIACIYRNGIIR